MLVAVGTTAADWSVSLVTLMIMRRSADTEQAVISRARAGGRLLQTALSVALWPVQRYDRNGGRSRHFFSTGGAPPNGL